MTREDSAAMRAAIELIVPQSNIAKGRKCISAREYKGVKVLIYGEGIFPAGMSMEIAKYFGEHGLKGQVSLTAVQMHSCVYSGVQIISTARAVHCIEFSYCKDGQAARLTMYCEPKQYNDICERLGAKQAIEDQVLLSSFHSETLHNQNIEVERLLGKLPSDKPYQVRLWSEELLGYVLDQLKLKADENGRISYDDLRDGIIRALKRHPEEFDLRSVYQLAIRPLEKAGQITRISDEEFVIGSYQAPVEALESREQEPNPITGMTDQQARAIVDTPVFQRVYTLLSEAEAVKRRMQQLNEQYDADIREVESLKDQIERLNQQLAVKESELVKYDQAMAGCEAEQERIQMEWKQLI